MDNKAQKPKTILIVEDEKNIQSHMKMAIETLGVHIQTVDNGEDFIETCLADHFDLILLDLNLPVLSGSAALKMIKSKNPGFKTPVIVFTNSTDLNKMSEVMGDNVAEYLVKADYSLDDLVEKVKNKLGL